MSSERLTFHIRYEPDEGGYCAWEPITGTASWGKDLIEAKAMITEALELYFEVVLEDDIPFSDMSDDDALILWRYGGYGTYDDFPGKTAALRRMLTTPAAPGASDQLSLVVPA